VPARGQRPNDLPLVEPVLKALSRACMRPLQPVRYCKYNNLQSQCYSVDLKLYTVNLLTKLLAYGIPDPVDTFHRASVWESLLSDNFVSGAKGEGRVRELVMQLLKYSATSGEQENKRECLALLVLQLHLLRLML